jgi:hypothetical protein
MQHQMNFSHTCGSIFTTTNGKVSNMATQSSPLSLHFHKKIEYERASLLEASIETKYGIYFILKMSRRPLIHKKAHCTTDKYNSKKIQGPIL